jgi:hypothetical protein
MLPLRIRERRLSSLGHTFVLLAFACSLGCIVQRGQKNDYLGAAVFAASGVGASVVNRKITGDCYASCPRGYACDHDSGLCEPKDCDCPADQVCEIVGGEKTCTQRRLRHEGDVEDGGVEESVP